MLEGHADDEDEAEGEVDGQPDERHLHARLDDALRREVLREARADAATEEVLAEERTAEQAKGPARVRRSKRKTKAGRPTAPEDGGLASLVTVPHLRELREEDARRDARHLEVLRAQVGYGELLLEP